MGSVSIEATLILPLFLATVFVILQASLWVHASVVAQAAAQDGVRATTGYLGSIAQGIDTAETILNARAIGQDWVVTTTTSGELVTVHVSGYAPSVVPGFEFAVRESASLPWEPR